MQATPTATYGLVAQGVQQFRFWTMATVFRRRHQFSTPLKYSRTCARLRLPAVRQKQPLPFLILLQNGSLSAIITSFADGCGLAA